jgi:excisionase family DNA binding protein
MPRTILLDQAAALLGVSRRTIYYRIRDGRLRTVRIGVTQRVLFESLEALRAEQEALKDPDAGASDTGPSAKSPAP